jgi:hypothetical protein
MMPAYLKELYKDRISIEGKEVNIGTELSVLLLVYSVHAQHCSTHKYGPPKRCPHGNTAAPWERGFASLVGG